MVTSNKEILIEECVYVFKEIQKHGFRFRAINKHFLGFAGLYGSRGMDDTVDKIREQLRIIPEGDVLGVKEKLMEKYFDFVSYADKEVFMLKLLPEEVRKIIDWFEGGIVKENAFKECFPNLPAPDSVSYDEYYPAKISKSAGKTNLYFGSKRKVRERVDLNEDDLTHTTRVRLEGLEKIAAYTLNDLLSIDMLCIDEEACSCEVRLTNSSNKNMTALSIDEALSAIYRKIQVIISDRRVIDTFNFYPCIMPLYQDRNFETSGRVTKFFFEADENGHKKETKPRDKGDLRKEKYHGSGSEAIDYKFRPFAIKKVWDIKGAAGSYQTSVDISGSPRILEQFSPKIDQVSVTGCYSEFDYRFMMTKVLPFAI